MPPNSPRACPKQRFNCGIVQLNLDDELYVNVEASTCACDLSLLQRLSKELQKK